MFFYSKSTKGFYSVSMHGDAMPVDVVPVPESEYAALMAAQSAGKHIEPGHGGRPIAVDRPVAPSPELLLYAKADLRAKRAPMLDALSGIAGRATRAGNDFLAAEADAIALQLLDITDDAALNVATTFAEMQEAGVQAYMRIHSMASSELRIVFRETFVE